MEPLQPRRALRHLVGSTWLVSIIGLFNGCLKLRLSLKVLMSTQSGFGQIDVGAVTKGSFPSSLVSVDLDKPPKG